MHSLVVAVLSLLVVFFISTMTIEARSTGTDFNCDLSYKNGTAGSGVTFPYGSFGRNKTAGAPTYPPAAQYGAAMNWANWPLPTDIYTLRTSDDATPADDVKSYTPGRTIELHLRVRDLNRRYIGLVMYASNSTTQSDSAVGTWSFSNDAPFQTTACLGGKQGMAVTHINAEEKNIHTRFFWTAPAAGAGTVNFRLLIKQGEQNKGEFFYLAKPLVLTQGPAYVEPTLPAGGAMTPTNEPVLSTTKVSQTVIGTVSSACANVCLKQTPATPYCDSTKTKAINSVATLQSAILANTIPCRDVILSGCQYAGGAHFDSEGYCRFRSESLTACPKKYQSLNPAVTLPPDVCFSASASTNRPICICSNDKTVQAVNPYAPKSARRMLLEMKEYEEQQATYPVSAASGKSVSTMIIAAVTSMMSAMFTKSTRTSVFLAVSLMMLSLATPSHAHNYIKGLHRAEVASVTVPCQQRFSNQPHVQVIKGQPFEIQWSLGHSEYQTDFYFLTVREDDFDKLRADNITKIIKDYLALAWTEKTINASVIPPGYNKVHMRSRGETVAVGNESLAFAYDQIDVGKTDPNYFELDPEYRKMAHPFQYGRNGSDPKQRIEFTTYKNKYLQNDKRASYQSSKYPWILSAALFYNYLPHTYAFDQSDIARFTIPDFATTGNHIVYFNWAGYKDCVDVHLLDSPTPVVNRYGLQPNSTTATTSVVKLDHSEYWNVGYPSTKCYLVNQTTMDVSACLSSCQYALSQGWGCMGVQITRAVNPVGTLPWTPNIPNSSWVAYADDYNVTRYGPKLCTGFDVHSRRMAGCKQNNVCTGVDWSGDNMYCFGLMAIRDQDFQVKEDIRTTNDPTDPAYYSTVMILDGDKKFINLPQKDSKLSSWITTDNCMKCDVYSKLPNVTAKQFGIWHNALQPAGQCDDCRMTNSDDAVATWQPKLAGANQASAGRKDAAPYTAPTSSSTAVASSSTATPSSTAATSSSSTSTATASSSGTKSSTATTSSSTATTSSSTATTSSSSGVASSSSTSTGVDSSSSSSGTSGPIESQAVQTTIRLTVDWNTADSESFKTTFVNSVASALGIAASRVRITAMRQVAADNSKRASSKLSSQRALLQTTTSQVDFDFLILPSQDGTGPTVVAASQNFNTQLTQPNSPLLQSSVGTILDKSVTPQQVNVAQCPNGSYVTPCPATGDDSADGGNDGSSSSGLSSMTLGLIIAGAIIGVLLLGAILFIVVKSVSAKQTQNKQIQKLAVDSHANRGSVVA